MTTAKKRRKKTGKKFYLEETFAGEKCSFDE
jgi:hypothetical protein